MNDMQGGYKQADLGVIPMEKDNDLVGAGFKPAPTSPRRKSLRLRGYDYTQAGFYFITVCTQDRIGLFGEINDGIMQLNSHGALIEQAW